MGVQLHILYQVSITDKFSNRRNSTRHYDAKSGLGFNVCEKLALELADQLGLAGMSSPRDGHSKELQSPIRSPGSGGRSRRAGAGGRGPAARAAGVDSVQRAAAATPAIHGPPAGRPRAT